MAPLLPELDSSRYSADSGVTEIQRGMENAICKKMQRKIRDISFS